jgi:hypothetical protein
MAEASDRDESKKRRRDRGDAGIWWDKSNHSYVGAISLGHRPDGKRDRPSMRGRTKTEVKNRLDELRDEIKAGVRTSATYTIQECVQDWFASLERDPHTMETMTGQAKTGSIRGSARRSSGTSAPPTRTGSSSRSRRR